MMIIIIVVEVEVEKNKIGITHSDKFHFIEKTKVNIENLLKSLCLIVTMANIPMANIPMANIPMANIPMANIRIYCM
jgi:hypothetical protein